jgi:hypothetical protein
VKVAVEEAPPVIRATGAFAMRIAVGETPPSAYIAGLLP